MSSTSSISPGVLKNEVDMRTVPEGKVPEALCDMGEQWRPGRVITSYLLDKIREKITVVD